MGDENSLAGTTKAHKHTSPASDGGFLETTETGVTNMSEGSLGYYDSSSVLTELSSGGSGTVLTMGASLPAWGAVTSGTASSQSDRLASTFTTSSSSFVTTGLSLTENNNTGISIAQFNPMFGGDTTSNFAYAIFNDGVIDNMSYQMTQTGGTHPNGSSTYSHTADQSVLTARVAALEGGSLELEGSATFSSNFIVSEYG